MITNVNTIASRIERSEETISISEVTEESVSDPEQVVACPIEDSAVLQTASGSATEVTQEPHIDWSTEDTDIGEPPIYMLSGTEVDDDDGWQISGGRILPSFRNFILTRAFSQRSPQWSPKWQLHSV